MMTKGIPPPHMRETNIASNAHAIGKWKSLIFGEKRVLPYNPQFYLIGGCLDELRKRNHVFVSRFPF